VASNYLSVELTDIVAALAGLAAAVVTLRVWTPRGSEEAAARLHGEHEAETSGPQDRREADRSRGPEPARRRRRQQQALGEHAAGLTRGGC
jgi:lactate permease